MQPPMITPRIDLNCDLGEAPDVARDAAMLQWVTSANVACGGHAGDERTMAAIVREAVRRGVGIGAHPGYPDRPGFGRVEIPLPPAQLEAAVAEQVRTLARVAIAHHAELRHVKPHGALYHACRRPEVARAVARGVGRWSRTLVLVGQALSPALDLWASMGFAVAAEAFADRVYEPDGTLRSRSLPGALLADAALAAAQAVSISTAGRVVASDGSSLTLRADTICVHSDTPGALEVVRAVQFGMHGAGVDVRPMGPPAAAKHPGHDSNVRPAL